MKINLFKPFGILDTDIVNAEDRTINLSSPALGVKINLAQFPVEGNVCHLPSSFKWGMGANSLTVIDSDNHNVPCGLIIRGTTGDMEYRANTRAILICLATSLYDAHSTIDKHSGLIDECLNFCKYPDLFKKIN